MRFQRSVEVCLGIIKMYIIQGLIIIGHLVKVLVGKLMSFSALLSCNATSISLIHADMLFPVQPVFVPGFASRLLYLTISRTVSDNCITA